MSADNIVVISVEAISEENEETENQSRKSLSHSHQNSVSMWNWFYIIGILTVFMLLGSPVFFIPRHNTIFYQEYWYDPIKPLMFFTLYSAANIIFNCSVFTKEKSLRSITLLLKVYAWNIFNWAGFYTLCYIAWVFYLEQNHPMPLLGTVCTLYSWSALLCGVWLLFPRDLMEETEFRNKMKTYVLYSSWWLVMHVQKDILTIMFANRSVYIEWTFALMVPCVKEMNKRVLIKLVHKMAGGEDETSNVLLGIIINVHYALFIAIRLSGSQITTIICMTTIDFILHLKMTYDLIRIQNKTASIQNEKDDLERARKKTIAKLVLAELCEGMVPLAYALGFSMMYLGPNSSIFGSSNMKFDDVVRMFGVMLALFSIDIISVALNACLLWVLAELNIAQEFCKILKKYWHIMALKLSLTIFLTLNSKDINLGSDFSLNFSWITDEGRMMMIYNSTDLSEMEKMILLSNSSLP